MQSERASGGSVTRPTCYHQAEAISSSQDRARRERLTPGSGTAAACSSPCRRTCDARRATSSRRPAAAGVFLTTGLPARSRGYRAERATARGLLHDRIGFCPNKVYLRNAKLIPDHDGSTVVALSLSVPSSSVAFRPKRQRVAVLQPRAPNTDTTLCSRTSPFAATSSCAGAPQVRAGASWH